MKPKTIAEWQSEVHALAVEKGWWDIDLENKAIAAVTVAIASKAFAHLAVSDTVEAIRDGKTGREERGDAWWAKVECSSPESIVALSKLVLIHSEVSEAVEAAILGVWSMQSPAGKPEGLVVELADAVIRIMDLCQKLDLDLESAMAAKHEYNKTRSHRHGGKLA